MEREEREWRILLWPSPVSTVRWNIDQMSYCFFQRKYTLSTKTIATFSKSNSFPTDWVASKGNCTTWPQTDTGLLQHSTGTCISPLCRVWMDLLRMCHDRPLGRNFVFFSCSPSLSSSRFFVKRSAIEPPQLPYRR